MRKVSETYEVGQYRVSRDENGLLNVVHVEETYDGDNNVVYFNSLREMTKRGTFCGGPEVAKLIKAMATIIEMPWSGYKDTASGEDLLKANQ